MGIFYVGPKDMKREAEQFAAKKRAELVTLLTHLKKAEKKLNQLEFYGALALYFIEEGMSFDEWDLNARWDKYYSGKAKFKELQKFVKKCRRFKNS